MVRNRLLFADKRYRRQEPIAITGCPDFAFVLVPFLIPYLKEEPGRKVLLTVWKCRSVTERKLIIRRTHENYFI